MFIVVYGRLHPLPGPQTLAAFLRSLPPLVPFVVALNEEFVLRGSFDDLLIYPGDRIDIVHPAAGG